MTETMTSPDLPQPDTQSLKRIVVLAWLCLIVAVVVLMIDNTIKRQIVSEAERTLKRLADLKVAAEAKYGTEPAGEATAGPGDSVNSDHGVDDAAGASAEPVPDAGNGLGPEAGRVSRPFGGPRGDG